MNEETPHIMLAQEKRECSQRGEIGLRSRNNEGLVQSLLQSRYEKYYRIAYSYVHNENDAMDIVQEAAYKAIYHAEKLKQPGYADTWICRIVMNESLNYIKRNKEVYVELEEVEIGKEEMYEDMDLRRLLERLSPKDKTVIVLRYFEEMSLEQIAEVCNENLSTTKSRLYRALRKLKAELQREGIEYEL